jgi:hypothetical protein
MKDLFTVIPSERYDTAYNLGAQNCRSPTVLGSWVPPLEKLLEVKIEGPSGAVSEVGWPACCMSPPYSLHFSLLVYLVLIPTPLFVVLCRLLIAKSPCVADQ